MHSSFLFSHYWNQAGKQAVKGLSCSIISINIPNERVSISDCCREPVLLKVCPSCQQLDKNYTVSRPKYFKLKTISRKN